MAILTCCRGKLYYYDVPEPLTLTERGPAANVSFGGMASLSTPMFRG